VAADEKRDENPNFKQKRAEKREPQLQNKRGLKKKNPNFRTKEG